MKRNILLLIIIPVLFYSCEKKGEHSGGELTESQTENILDVEIPAMEMISLPAAGFIMGSNSGDADETPEHRVIFTKDIFMGTYEVTNAQVAAVYTWGLIKGAIKAHATTVVNTEGEEQELIDIDYPGCRIQYNGHGFIVTPGFEQHPCTLISWYGAIVFCNLLSMIEEKQPVYNLSDWSWSRESRGYRLPTEAEWEFAARGGTKSKNFSYSGSNEPGDVGWFGENSGGTTHPVGQKTPNELGFYDMSGNVWECCWDYYSYYIPLIISRESFTQELLPTLKGEEQKKYIEQMYLRNNETGDYNLSQTITNEDNRKIWEIFHIGGYKMGSRTDPAGLMYRKKRLLRGGDWGSVVFYLRNTYRGRIFAQVSGTGAGFRVVMAK